MKIVRKKLQVVAFASLSLVVGLALLPSGCGSSGAGGQVASNGGTGGGSGGSDDGGSGGVNQGGNTGGDGGGIITNPDGGVNECGNHDPTCTAVSTGPTGHPSSQFPLPSDDPAPDNVDADGVTRDGDGFITLDSTKAKFDFLWVADDMNYGVGFVSKISTTRFSSPPYYREVARYPSVTCMSDPQNGSNEGIVLGTPPAQALCADGVHGCCARDESQAGPNGGHQAVQVFGNRPSRTAVDVNGDVWVANRAHASDSGQPSITKIANSLKDCIDRNGNGKIDTSSDVNGDGIITTDCDDNNLPDNGSTVCSPGKSHEFYGLDDECVLFTTNFSSPGGIGRPLALGPGVGQNRGFGPSDAWVGSWKHGVFYRVRGADGKIIQHVQMKAANGVDPHPYGAVIDQYGILWAPGCCQNALFYFDTKDFTKQGMVQAPFGDTQFYGIALDGMKENDGNGNQKPLQQIWLGDVKGSGAFRYRPKRDGTFEGLSKGTWAKAAFTGGATRGRGLGVDMRKPTPFVWVALDGHPSWNGHIGRIPIDIPDGVTNLNANLTFDTTQRMTTGAGVAFDGDVWGVNQESSSAVHFKVDAQGNVVGAPDVVPLDDNAAKPENFCGHAQCKPHPYTYSDFTGFGLRNFTNPHGYYSWIEKGNCKPGKTRFLRVEWDGDTPAGTEILVTARSAADKAALENASWTGQYKASPADLSAAPGPLDPNPSDYIEVMFELTTNSEAAPKLKSFKIVYQCEGGDVPR